MSSWNDKVLFTDKVEFAIKVDSTHYATDQLIDINLDLAILNEYWKSTSGKLNAAPINQNSKFSFSTHKSTDFYSSNNMKTLGDFRNNIFSIPPQITNIEFRITGQSEDGTSLVEEYDGVIDDISSVWVDTDGTEKITVSGTILGKV